jgi:uncharacterized repeat protein (TIGR01451 family)
MNLRNRLAAVLAASSLAMAVGAVALAGPPTYTFNVVKSANPSAVPPSGGTVTFTIAVDNTGTGHFTQVIVADSMAGCTAVLSSGDTDADGNLDDNETWNFTCTVTNVTPGMSNTATVNGCHSSGPCNNTTHDAQDIDTVTLTEGPEVTQPPATDPPATDPPATDPPATDPPATDPPATDPPATDPPATDPPATDPPATDPPATDPPATDPPATDPPATDPPATDPPVTDPPVTDPPATPDPTDDVSGESDDPQVTPEPTDDVSGESDGPAATQASTDALGASSSRPADTTWMLVLSLGLLLASIVVVSPPEAIRRRNR